MLSDGYHHPIALHHHHHPPHYPVPVGAGASNSSVIKENHAASTITSAAVTSTGIATSSVPDGSPSPSAERQLQVPKVSAGPNPASPSPVITYHAVHGGSSSVYTSHPKILHSMKSIAADVAASSKSDDSLGPPSPHHHHLSVYGRGPPPPHHLHQLQQHPAVVVVVPKQESASSTTTSGSPPTTPPVIMDNSVASSSNGGVGGSAHNTPSSPGPKGEPDLNIVAPYVSCSRARRRLKLKVKTFDPAYGLSFRRSFYAVQ
uniref:Uncharacterized protein n=1 Tax=Anopheles culicifacies TaxID=139723 RepID=A0A182MCJ6_9DIPT